MRRMLLAILVLSLLISMIQPSPSLAQGGEEWFNVSADIRADGIPLYMNIFVNKDGSAHGEAGYSGNEYVFEGRYDTASKTLSGSFKANWNFEPLIDATVQMKFREDMSSMDGTITGTRFQSSGDSTTSRTFNDTFTASAYGWSEPVAEETEEADFTIVIPAGHWGFDGNQDTRIEVKKGIIDTAIKLPGFIKSAQVKGTYDPKKGVLNATLTVAPHLDEDNFWVAYDATLTMDFANNGTAGFVTVKGKAWTWTEEDGVWKEGDDKGPPTENNGRIFYTVEFRNGKVGTLKTKDYGDNVDSNIRINNSFGSHNKAYIKRAYSDELIVADEETPIYVGDTIIVPPTPPDELKGIPVGFGLQTVEEDPSMPSGYSKRISPESNLRIKPGTNITISEPAEWWSFGEFWYKHQKHPQYGAGEQFEDFDMQLSRLGVKLKGTTVVVKDYGGEGTVKVLEGVVECTDIETGEVIEVEAGEMISATTSGTEVNTFDVDAEQAEWEDLGVETDLESESDGFPVWLLILIIAIAVLILAAIIILLIKRSKAGKNAPTGVPQMASSFRGDPMSRPGAVPISTQESQAVVLGAFCTACGNPLREGLAFCNKCGNPVGGALPRQASCTACGKPLKEGMAFCSGCGKPA